MKVLPWAEFRSDLPDDHIEDGDQIVQFGGKSVIAAIGEMLTRCGCEVSEPIYADEHGWELNVKAGRRRLWCQVTLIDKYLFIFEQNSWFGKHFRRYPQEYIDALKHLSAELQSDPRFHEIEWFAEGEALGDKPGAKTPVLD
jgi:hypothetical protein